MPSQRYGQPTRLCDLVMKGGITSGVISPLAACELARTYSFKSIGGTSAGAIAAAAVAAAEYGRRRRGAAATGFETLASLPAWIGKPGRLLDMFRPDPSTRAISRVAMAALNPRTIFLKLVSLAGCLVAEHWLAAVIVTLAVYVAVSRLASGSADPLLTLYLSIVTALLGAAAFSVYAAVSFYRAIRTALPRNFYGLSLGFDPNSRSSDAPLTNWLTAYLNTLAEIPVDGDPLTFGDLHGAGPAPAEAGTSPGAAAIDLEMMTTAITLGRPFRLPFRDPDRLFYFSREDFARLFPARVV